jgi:hypothetical protein
MEAKDAAIAPDEAGKFFGGSFGWRRQLLWELLG